VKILIVSTFFPPKNSIASLRPYSWAKWWSKAGHDVTVLTTLKKTSESDLNLDCSFFRVISTKQKETISSKISSAKSSSFSFKKMILSLLKNLFSDYLASKGCFVSCRFPDWHDSWAKKSVSNVIDEKWDLVISTGWPYSVHRVGYALKKNNPSVKWIVDWRDLWTMNHLYEGFFLFRWYEKLLEKKFHRNADMITTVSEPLAETLRAMTSTPVVTITNGFDEDDFIDIVRKPRKLNKKFTIVYSGTIFKGFRDPAPLFKAVKNLISKNIISKNDLRIIFAGTKNTDMTDTAKEYGISDYFFYAGFLPREEILKMQYDADALLFLEYNDPNVKGVLTGKLFEYLYLAREIWAVGIESDSSAGSIIADMNAGECFGNDILKIQEYIVKVLKNKNVRKKNQKILSRFNRKNLALSLLDSLKKVSI